MDPLLEHDIEVSQGTDPSEKLAQALEMMASGARIKRAALRAADPGASESEIDEKLERWLTADG